MVKSNKQQMYDYESADKNIEHYGQVCTYFAILRNIFLEVYKFPYGK